MRHPTNPRWTSLIVLLGALASTRGVAAPPRCQLQTVELRQPGTEGEWLAITTSRPANFTSFKLSKPARIVVDFPETVVQSQKLTGPEKGPIAGWTLESLGADDRIVGRLIVELREEEDYTLDSTPGAIELRLVPAAARPLVGLDSDVRVNPTPNAPEPEGPPPQKPAQVPATEPAATPAPAPRPESHADVQPEEERARQQVEANRRAAEQAEQERREQQRAAELERQDREERRAAELAHQQQEQEQQRAAELERQRQEQQRAAELERQSQEREQQQKAAELERQRQDREEQRAAELAHQRQEQEQQRAAELERQRQEREAIAAAEAAKLAAAEKHREELRQAQEAKAREKAARKAEREQQAQARREQKRKAKEEARAKAAEEKAARLAAKKAAREAKEQERVEAQASKPAVLARIGFRREQSDAQLVLHLSAPAAFSTREASAGQVMLDLEHTEITVATNRLPLDTRFFGTAVTRIVPHEDRAHHRVSLEIDLSASVPYEVKSDGQTLTMVFHSVPAAAAQAQLPSGVGLIAAP